MGKGLTGSLTMNPSKIGREATSRKLKSWCKVRKGRGVAMIMRDGCQVLEFNISMMVLL
jgi:hypothetical protein